MKKQITYYLKKFLCWVKEQIVMFYDFFLLKPNPKESIIQYAFRSIMLPNADGDPSWTMTLTALVMGYMGIFVFVEYSLSFTMIRVYDGTTGNLISESARGISNYAWVAMITLLGAVVFFIKFRDQRLAAKNGNGNGVVPTEESEEKDSAIGTVVETAVNIVDKIKK